MKQVKGLGSRIKEAAQDAVNPRNGGGFVAKLKMGGTHSGGESSGSASAAEDETTTVGGTTTAVSDEGGGDEEDKVVEEEVVAMDNKIGAKFKTKMQEMGTGIKTATDAMTEGAGNVVNKLVIMKKDDSSSCAAKDDLEEGDGEDEIIAEEGTNDEKKKFRMPLDDVLQKMIIIGKQKIKGVSIQDYYEVAWSEGNDCEKEPMYGPFLTSCGKNDVKVQKWESHEEGYKGEWCGETYPQKRIVTFNFMKKTIGETLVSVQHTQRCRCVDNDRCVVHMTLKMDGFPYADCFVVEVRHVASRVGENDVLVEMGLHVRFLKSCLFEKKIRTNTTAETTKLQMDLLSLIIEGCKPYAKEIEGDDEEVYDEMEEEPDATAEESKDIICDLPFIRFIITLGAKIFLWPFIKLDLFDPFPPATVDDAIMNVRRRVVLLEKISCDGVTDDEQMKKLAKEMKAIQLSLKNIEEIASA